MQVGGRSEGRAYRTRVGSQAMKQHAADAVLRQAIVGHLFEAGKRAIRHDGAEARLDCQGLDQDRGAHGTGRRRYSRWMPGRLRT